MPRAKPLHPTVGKHIRIDSRLDAAITDELRSPISGEVPYGAWRYLIERLLRDWLQHRRADSASRPEPDPDTDPLAALVSSPHRNSDSE